MGIPVVEAFVAHEPGQETSVGSHTRDNDAHVLINLKHFFLEAGQVVRALFEAKKYLYFC